MTWNAHSLLYQQDWTDLVYTYRQELQPKNTTHPYRSPLLFVITSSPKTKIIAMKSSLSKAQISHESKEGTSSELNEVYENLPVSLCRAVDLATEKGSSTWLTALPLTEYGFALHKGAFHDALALRYGWSPLKCHQNVPVETMFQSSTRCRVQRGDSQPLDTTKSVI